MSQLLSLLATPGVDLTLRHLAGAPDSAYPRIQLEDFLHDHGATAPDSLVDRLIGENLLQWIGKPLRNLQERPQDQSADGGHRWRGRQ